MTDLEMTKLCAEAMGYVHTARIDDPSSYPVVQLIAPETGWKYGEPHYNFIEGPSEGQYPRYDPLHNDAQAMALGKAHPEEFEAAVAEWASMKRSGENPDLNRILCEMMAKK